MKLYNIQIPGKSPRKRDTATSCKEFMLNRVKRSKKIILKPLLVSSFKFAAKIMTSDESNVDNAKIHIKQHLNELHHADKLFKNSKRRKG